MTDINEMPLHQLERPSPLRDLAYERLRQELLPGGSLDRVDRLVERELADRLEMSRTPIRDALRRLAVAGIIEPLAGGGYVRRRVTLREVEELHELLALLEPVAAAMAARREPEAIEELLKSPAITRRDATPLANTRFHVAVAVASGNLVLARVIETLNERLGTEQQLTDPEEGSDRVVEGHEHILEALRRRNPDEAADVARRHIEASLDMLARRVRRGDSRDA